MSSNEDFNTENGIARVDYPWIKVMLSLNAIEDKEIWRVRKRVGSGAMMTHGPQEDEARVFWF